MLKGTIRRLTLAGLAAVIAGASASAQDKMTLTLNYLAQPAQAGFFLAKKRGYYKDAGIDLTIIEGKGSAVTSQQLAAGQTDIGFVGTQVVMDLISKGAPIKIVSAVIQGNFMSLATRAQDNIKTPQDLIGKTIAGCPGCAQVPMVYALLDREKIDKSKVTIINADASAMIGLLAGGKIDAAAADPNTVSIEMKKRGEKVNDMFFQDYGIRLINFVLAARTDRLAAKSDLYKRFIAASIKGWDEIRRNPEETVTALQEQYPEIKLDKDTLRLQLTQGIVPFVCIPAAPGVGRASSAAWEGTYEVLTKYMGFKTDKPVSAFYTDEYLPATLPSCN